MKFREPQVLPRAVPNTIIEIFLQTMYKQKKLAHTTYKYNSILRDIAVIELLFATGVRVSELCSLTPSQIDFTTYKIIINGKGAKERILQIGNEDVKEILSEYYIAYHEMAEHYGTAIIPARPVKPKDKPNAEGTVRVLETWILAALRNRKFFTFDELNKAIHEKLEEFNAKPFQKKKGSRLSAFIEEEKDFLMPLPASPYETAVWSTATIQPDYHI